MAVYGYLCSLTINTSGVAVYGYLCSLTVNSVVTVCGCDMKTFGLRRLHLVLSPSAPRVDGKTHAVNALLLFINLMISNNMLWLILLTP